MEHCLPHPRGPVKSTAAAASALAGCVARTVGKQRCRTRRRLITAAFLWAIILIAVSPVAEAGTVTGQFKLDTGGVIAPKTAAAYPVREQYDARSESVEIVLSTRPIDAASAANALNPHTGRTDQHERNVQSDHDPVL